MIARNRFAHLPTPEEELPRLSKALSGPRILVKRDDQTGLASGITTGPNDIMLPVHDRMSVIVAPGDYATWLTGEPGDALDLVKPYPTDAMQVWAVSKRVSRSGEEGGDLISPVEGG